MRVSGLIIGLLLLTGCGGATPTSPTRSPLVIGPSAPPISVDRTSPLRLAGTWRGELAWMNPESRGTSPVTARFEPHESHITGTLAVSTTITGELAGTLTDGRFTGEWTLRSGTCEGVGPIAGTLTLDGLTLTSTGLRSVCGTWPSRSELRLQPVVAF